jgi:hypothetical protein
MSQKESAMAEPEAGTVTTEQAQLLLLLDKASDLKALERDGAFTQIAPGRYWLKDLVQGYVKHQREHRLDCDTQTLAQVFGVNGQRISQLVNDGWFKPLSIARGVRGKYNWQEAVSGFIRFLRDEDRRSSKSASYSRIQDAKARDIEVRTQQRLSRLIPLEVYEEMIDNVAGMVRTEFAGLAAASTRDLTMRRIIEREVNAMLTRIATRALEQAVRLETTGRLDDAVTANGTGPMGGSEPDLPTDSIGPGAA